MTAALPKCLAFDLETTGVSTADDRIVTACAALVEGGQVVFERDWLIAVDVDIPAEASAVHGISTEHAREHGTPADVSVKEIAIAIRYAVHSKVSIAGFNLAFDLSLLNAECVRHGLGTLEEFCGAPVAPVLDGYVLDRAVDRYRKGKRKLGDVCSHYGVTLADAHNATADAVASVEVIRRIIERAHMNPIELAALYADRRYPSEMARAFRPLARRSPMELHDLQIGWYREQATGLGEWWAKEAARLRAEAARDVPPPLPELPDASDDERRQVLREQADELEQRIAGLNTSWPIRPLNDSAVR